MGSSQCSPQGPAGLWKDVESYPCNLSAMYPTEELLGDLLKTLRGDKDSTLGDLILFDEEYHIIASLDVLQDPKLRQVVKKHWTVDKLKCILNDQVPAPMCRYL
jgi:hypothetical protein